MLTSGAPQRNTTGIRAQILLLSGGGVRSSLSIAMSARRCSVSPLAHLECLLVDSMICRVCKEPSAFPSTEHTATPIGFLRLILVCCVHSRSNPMTRSDADAVLPGFNQIDLPQYSSYEMLRQQLLLAINEGGEGFGFA